MVTHPSPSVPLAPRLGRRGFLKIVAVGGLAAGLGAALTWPATERLQEIRLLMGTLVNLAVITPERAAGQAAVAATLAEMERLVGLFDHRRPSGPLGRLNAAGVLNDAPSELLDVLAAAAEVSALTGGAFDVTVKPALDAYRAGTTEVAHLRPLVDYRQVQLAGTRVTLARPGMALTLDGLAKGRVVDGAVSTLRARGFTNVLVEAGGDLLAHGQPEAGRAWQVGVTSPRDPAATLLAVPLGPQALATSGDYQNAFTADFALHHILDPRTLRSPAALAGATVLAPTAMQADALSTALLVLGPADGLALVERLPGVAALLVGKDLQLYRSAGFPGPA